MNLKKIFGTIPPKYKLMIFVCYSLPLIFDKPDGSTEIVWLFYLIPPLFIAFYHGFRGGIFATLLTFVVITGYEAYEYFEEPSYNNKNSIVILGILLSVSFVAIGIGTLMEKLRKKQYELETLNLKFEYMAHHDWLSGLSNRRLFDQNLAEAINCAKNAEQMCALIFFDLDRFKSINDTLGHSSGDLIIQKVAELLRNCVGPGATIARLGGDEFIVLLEKIDSYEEITTTAQSIIDALEEPFNVRNVEVSITASLGIAVYPKDGDTPGTLMKSADLAMYKVKEQGKDNFLYYTTSLREDLDRKTHFEKGLRQALEYNEFALYYQPQLDINSLKIVGAEALIRWHNPEFGLITPGEFIPMAEETGLIVPIGEWVLRTAIKEATHWNESGHRLKVAVNVSALQFQKKHCVELVQQILWHSKFDPKYLELELTESVALLHPENVIIKLQALRQLGVNISIDDFGTGYSSLSYLKDLPVNTVKIDRSFIKDITTDRRDRAVVAAIIAMAKTLEFNIIAEGIEREDQLAIISELKCNQVQGYLFSKPLPAEDFRRLLYANDPLEPAFPRLCNEETLKNPVNIRV